MNECVEARRDAFETHLAGALPLDALGAGGVRGVHDDARGGDGQHDARWERLGLLRPARAGRRRSGARARGGEVVVGS